MTYHDWLHPWCIVRSLPNLQSIKVARFRHRTEAEAHLRMLQQLVPKAIYAIVFEMRTDVRGKH